jgi:hypothetical protein
MTDDLFDVALPPAMLADVATAQAGPFDFEEKSESKADDMNLQLLSLDDYFEELSRRRNGRRSR